MHGKVYIHVHVKRESYTMHEYAGCVVYLIRCLAVTIGSVAQTPDLPQQNAIAPHITGRRVLPVVESLQHKHIIGRKFSQH